MLLIPLTEYWFAIVDFVTSTEPAIVLVAVVSGLFATFVFTFPNLRKDSDVSNH